MNVSKAAVVVTLFTLYIVSFVKATGIGLNIFDEINNFAKRGLSVAKFQRYLEDSDDIRISSVPVNAQAVKDLAKKVENILRELENVLEGLSDGVTNEYTSDLATSNPRPLCKDVTANGDSILLPDKVDFSNWCLTGDSLELPGIEYISNPSFLNDWKQSYGSNKGIKYIKIADKNGVLYNYPARPRVDEDKPYDARFSTWYVETTAIKKRDLVIMVDMSGSMRSNSALQIAKQAAITVLNTLNSNDRVAIIAFGDNARTPTGENGKDCYSEQLAKATDINKENLESFVNNINAETGNPSYSNAFAAAFDFFDSTPEDNTFQNETPEKVIILLTDGKTSENFTTVCDTVSTMQMQLQEKVVIIPYGVGTDIQNHGLLQRIGQQECILGQSITRLDAMNITSIGALSEPDAMSSYYEYFTFVDDSIRYSVPYQDIFSQGTQMSLCSMILKDSKPRALFCIDIALEYLLNDVTYSKSDEDTYAFLIDDQFRVLSHPLLPNTEQISAEYFFVYLPNVEITDNIMEMQRLISQNVNGNFSNMTLRIIPQASGGGQNVLTRYQLTHYFWERVANSIYTVGLVTVADAHTRLDWQGARSDIWYHTDNNELEHRNDLCRSFQRISARDRIAITLTPRAIDDPYRYSYFKSPTQAELKRYLDDKRETEQNPGLKVDVRDTVFILQELEKLWTDAELSESIVWRYFATRNGIVVTFPGLELPKLYDGIIRPWYLGAMADQGALFITPPYIDLWGAGTVISLTTAATSERTGAIGVIAMDFTIESFYYGITSTIEDCSQSNYKCIVINNKGFLIVHTDWIEEDNPAIGEEDIHIVQEEPNIAQSLIREQILEPKSCIDIARSFRQNRYWQINNEKVVEKDGDIIDTDKYEIHDIQDTNLYLIIKKKSYATVGSCTCLESGECPSADCHCPCTSDTNAYEYCIASLDTAESPPCSPQLAKQNTTALLSAERERLESLKIPDCVDYKCPLKDNKPDCSRTLSCQWCIGDNNAEDFCTRDESCDPDDMSDDDENNDGGLASWAIALIVIFVVIVVIVVVLVVIFVLARRQPDIVMKPDDQTEYNKSRETNDRRALPENLPIGTIQHARPLTHTYCSTPTQPKSFQDQLKPEKNPPATPKQHPKRPEKITADNHIKASTLPGFGSELEPNPHEYENSGIKSEVRWSADEIYDRIPSTATDSVLYLHPIQHGAVPQINSDYITSLTDVNSLTEPPAATIVDKNFVGKTGIPMEADDPPQSNIMITPPRVDDDPEQQL